MEAEEVLTLLDSYWFGQQIFKKISIIKPSSSPNQDLNFQNNSSKPHIFSQSSIHKRSQSDQMMNNSIPNLIYDSPNSVLYSPPQQKQSNESNPTRRESRNNSPEVVRTPKKPKKKKRAFSKSLSELEFEEVKGFMDLGFVFSEEDRETSLVEIIPGLQRLGNEKDRGEKTSGDNNNKSSIISRPYLSEAWDELDERERRENPLMNWRIPSVINDEVDMKDNLKWWAQAVASTVIR